MERPPLDELLSLFQATVAAEGVTTGAGDAAGTSIIDAGLIGAGANSFVSMLMILYPGEPLLVDSQDITAFDNVTGEVTYSGAYKGVAAAIPAGVAYKIVTFRFVPAEVAALAAALAAHEAAQAISRAALGTHDTDIKALLNAIAGYIDTEIAAIETKLDTPANFMANLTTLETRLSAARALLLDEITALRMAELDPANLPTDVANVKTDTGNIILDTQVRSITSAGKAITFGAGNAKWLNIDSGTNGAEILAIILNNYVGKDWTVDTYVPYVDAVAAPAAIDKRDTFSIINTDAEGGLLKPTGIAFNMFLNFTNDAGAGDDTMTVTIVYRSRAVLTLAWEA